MQTANTQRAARPPILATCACRFALAALFFGAPILSSEAQRAASSTASISGNLILCRGAATQLTASAGDAYEWSTGATTQSIEVSLSGNYAVTVHAASSTATAAVLVKMDTAAPHFLRETLGAESSPVLGEAIVRVPPSALDDTDASLTFLLKSEDMAEQPDGTLIVHRTWVAIDNCGQKTTAQQQVHFEKNILEKPENQAFASGAAMRIFPNPATGERIFLLIGRLPASPLRVVLTDVFGNMVGTREANIGQGERLELDVGGLGSGIYRATLFCADGNSITKPFILKKDALSSIF